MSEIAGVSGTVAGGGHATRERQGEASRVEGGGQWRGGSSTVAAAVPTWSHSQGGQSGDKEQ